MFLYEDTVGKGILVVIIHDPYTALQDNGAAVQALVNEMHGTSGHFYPMKERLPLGVETGETGRSTGWILIIIPAYSRTIADPRMRI